MISRLLQLAKESAVYGLSGIITSSIMILLVPIYTRVFSPADYGTIAMVTSIIGVMSIFVGLGAEASVAVYFYDTEDRKRRAELVFNYIVLQVGTASIIGFLVVLLSRNLASYFIGSSSNALYLQLAALTLVFSAFGSVIFNLFRLLRRPWVLVTFNIAMTLTKVTASIVLVVALGYDLLGNFAAQLGVAVLFFILSIWLLRKWLTHTTFSSATLFAMVRLGLPYVFTGLALWAITTSNRFFLEHYHNLTEVGLYSIGNYLSSALGLVTGSFQIALWPYALSIQHEPDAKTTYANILSTFFALGAGLAVALSIFSHEILSVLTTAAYLDASKVVPFLTFYVVCVSLGYIASLGTWFAKKTINLAWTTAIGAGANISLNYLLIPTFGIIGAGIATLVSQTVYMGLLFWVSQRYYPIPYRWRDLFWIAVISASLIFPSQLVGTQPLIAAMALKLMLLCVYPLALLTTGVIKSKTVLHMVGLLRRLLSSGASRR